MPSWDWEWWENQTPQERKNREKRWESDLDRRGFKRIEKDIEEDEED